MNSSQEINELAAALAKAQAEMGASIKGAENPFFKSKYADLGSVIKAVKEPFANNGLSFVQFPLRKENTAGVTTRLMHSSGQWLEDKFTLPVGKFDAQGVGSCLTYARRYALQAIAGIPAADDDGNAASHPQISEADIAKEYEKACELLSKGTPADFILFSEGLDESMRDMVFNRAPKGKISAFKKAWNDRVNGFWWPLKEIKSQLPELVKKQDDLGVRELVEDLSDIERERLLIMIDDVSKTFIESMGEKA